MGSWRRKMAGAAQADCTLGGRAAVLRDATVTSGTAQFVAIQAVAPSLGIEVSRVNVSNAADIERGVGAVAALRIAV